MNNIPGTVLKQRLVIYLLINLSIYLFILFICLLILACWFH